MALSTTAAIPSHFLSQVSYCPPPMAYPYQDPGFYSPLHAHISDAPDKAEDDNHCEHPEKDGGEQDSHNDEAEKASSGATCWGIKQTLYLVPPQFTKSNTSVGNGRDDKSVNASNNVPNSENNKDDEPGDASSDVPTGEDDHDHDKSDDASSDTADAEDDDDEDKDGGNTSSDAPNSEGDDDKDNEAREGKSSDVELNIDHNSSNMLIMEDNNSNDGKATVMAQEPLGEDKEYEHSGSSPHDVPDPSFILRSSAKHQIKLIPQASNVMKVYAAIRAISPFSIDFMQVGLSTVQLPDLEHRKISWEPSTPTEPYEPGNSPHMLSLCFQNEAEDDPIVITIPLVDLHEDPFAPLTGVHVYLLGVASGQEEALSEDFGLQTQRHCQASSITSIDTEDDNGTEDAEDYNKGKLEKQPLKVQEPKPEQPPCSAQKVIDAGIEVLSAVRQALANLAEVSEAYVQKGDRQDIWQLFTSYFHEHTDEMIELAKPNILDGVECAFNTVAGLCYPTFKAKYPDGKYSEILFTYEGLCKLTEHEKMVHT
ncbi:hypothetical protein BDN71DRAFT_1434051 [Pleurotus eryngii]|uniref:Uncharacterized protein n=1 Tax=Pleurotus eryngii TaxID=5323 RepID=A0A9P5ZNG4_PLEER|nr:hypothetical protein BDN71DRAFT_1434051 [Pleurotus eryngii]